MCDFFLKMLTATSISGSGDYLEEMYVKHPQIAGPIFG